MAYRTAWCYPTKKGRCEEVIDNFGHRNKKEVVASAKRTAKQWDKKFPKKQHWVRPGKRKVFIYSKKK